MSPTIPERADAPRVHAAGVVAIRGVGKRREVLVLHRPDRDDWSLPKGKVDPGERLAATAVRETLEETGIAVTLGVPLTPTHYKVSDPKSSTPLRARKTVWYWRAAVQDPAIAQGDQDVPSEWVPNDEVDEVRWVRASRLQGLLSYAHDLDVVEEALNAPAHTTPFIIVRHAQAEKRGAWREIVGPEVPDQLRPLTVAGAVQAQALADVFAAYGIAALAASSATRCMDTMQPSVTRVGAAVLALPGITEEAFAEHPKRGVRDVVALLQEPAATALCIHRPTKKRLMRAIGELVEQEVGLALAPAEYVVLHRVHEHADGTGAIRLGASTIVEIGAHHA